MKCSNCGSEVKEGAKFCRECGSEIVEKTEALEGNTCPECGNLLEEDAMFCNNCGHRVSGEDSETEVSNRCPNCNSPLKDGALFCGECGASLTAQPVQKTVSNESPKKKKDKGLVFLVVLLIVVLVGSIGVIGYVYYQNNSVDIETPDINIETKIDEDEEDEIETETDTNTESEENEEPEDIYLFPSDREYITESDLSGKSKDEVAMIRNEIYARHGYIFNTEPFKSYFESQEWYVPNENFNDSIFSEIEKTNKDFLVKYEEDRGWR